MSCEPKNVILSNLLLNSDDAWKKPKFDFLDKIMAIEAKYKFMDETTVDSLILGYMARV